VLINNAANFYAGYFEEISPAQMRQQIETNLFGPMNVTRAVLPFMRQRRSGHIITISLLAGLVGQEFCVAYAAAKFGVEGWMESLRFDVAPFGINTTIIEPGFFRTELLVDASTSWPMRDPFVVMAEGYQRHRQRSAQDRGWFLTRPRSRSSVWLARLIFPLVFLGPVLVGVDTAYTAFSSSR